MRKGTVIVLMISLLLVKCKRPHGDFRFSTAMARIKIGTPRQKPLLSFLWAGDFSHGFAPVKMEGKFGYIDTSGNVAISPRYSAAGGYSENRAPIMMDGKWGYLDVTGNVCIKPAYDWAGPFKQGRAVVADNSGYAFIDTSGQPVGTGGFSDAHAFSEGYAAVRIGEADSGAWGFIDLQGNLSIPPLFTDVPGGFSGGFAAVRVGLEPPYRTGYVDTSGGYAIDTTYDAGGDFSEGLAPVGRGEWRGSPKAGFQGLWGYIDSTGRLAIPMAYAEAGKFKDGKALVRLPGGGARLIARDGSVVRAYEDDLEILSAEGEGRVTFRLRKLCGYLDSAGGLAIKPRYPEAGPFCQGRARVKLGGSDPQAWAFIGKDGKFLGGVASVP